MGLNIAIFISGNGSNMLNIIQACKKKKIDANVKIVVSNNPDSKGLKKIDQNETKIFIVQEKKFKNKKSFENKISSILKSNKIDLICLAGYMRILSQRFVDEWPNKIINIHPSLLPSFKGLNAQKQAFESGVKFTGCTIHFVNNELDGGKIIDQVVVKINKKDNLEELKKKILIEEHKLYINVLKNFKFK